MQKPCLPNGPSRLLKRLLCSRALLHSGEKGVDNPKGNGMLYHELTTSPLLILLLGVAVTYIGYGPFSKRKNPTAGVGFAATGFLLRLAGPLLLAWDACLAVFMMSMTR